MNSYIQFIDNGNRRWDSWYNGIRSGFLSKLRENVTPTDQLRFILDQTLILSELFWLYGARGHLYLTSYSKCIKEFTDTVISDQKWNGIHASIVKDIKNIQSVWYGAEWIDVDINTIKIFLFDLAGDNKESKICPYTCSKYVVIPYLMHRNRYIQEGYKEYLGPVGLPRMYISGPYISVYTQEIGIKFMAKFEDKFERKNFKVAFDNIKRFSILTFLAKTTLRYKFFDEVLGLLAGMCIHTDNTRMMSANFGLFYATFSILNFMFSADFANIAQCGGRFIVRTRICQQQSMFFEQARALFTLLDIKHREDGSMMSSKEFFIRFFGEFVRTNDGAKTDLAKVLELVVREPARGDGAVAAEDLKTFSRLVGYDCGLEAIQLISRQATPTTQDTGADEIVEDPEVDPEIEAESFDSLFPDEASAGLEAEAKDGDPSEEEEDSAPAEDDEGDPSSGEGNEDDDPPSNAGDDNVDENASSEDPGGSEDPNTVNTQTTGTPENVEASDDDGIEIRFVPEGSETVESVVLREELDQFISEILQNPPKKLSPQAVSALIALQQYCIHLLSVETIVGILGKIVSLPDKFKDIKNTHGENS